MIVIELARLNAIWTVSILCHPDFFGIRMARFSPDSYHILSNPEHFLLIVPLKVFSCYFDDFASSLMDVFGLQFHEKSDLKLSGQYFEKEE